MLRRLITLTGVGVGLYATTRSLKRLSGVLQKTSPNSVKAQLLNSLTPASGWTVQKNIAYGQLPRQKLDIYKPKKLNHKTPATHNLPVLVFVHGGSWKTGSKDDYVFLAESFTRAGFLVAVVNYHLAPEHIYPRFVEDTVLALKWVYEHVANFGGDTKNIMAMGHSAGAFNLITAVNNASFFKAVDLPEHAVKAVVGIAGPYNYDFLTDVTAYAFPNVPPMKIMPVYCLRDEPVPHLLLTAEKDNLVMPSNTDDLLSALRKKGATVQAKQIKNTNHITIIASFASRLTMIANTREQVLAFLNQYISD